MSSAPQYRPDWDADPTLPDSHHLTGDHDDWRTLSRELKFDGDYAKLFMETVATPARPEGVTWTVVRRKSAVAVAARTVEGKWLLVRQERVAIRQSLWEMPAGQVDTRTEDLQQSLIDTVWRELREEAGYEPGPETTLTPMGVFFPSAGFTDEHSWLFLADNVVPHIDGASPDEAESIEEFRAFSTSELRQMIANDTIRDGNTLAAFARMCALGLV